MFGRRSIDRSIGGSRHHFELREGNAEGDAAAAAPPIRADGRAKCGKWPVEKGACFQRVGRRTDPLLWTFLVSAEKQFLPKCRAISRGVMLEGCEARVKPQKILTRDDQICEDAS